MNIHLKNWLSAVTWHVLGIALIFAISGCDQSTAAPASSGTSIPKYRPKIFSLSLTGYNYTKRYIDTFSVDGQVGGNIYVSSPSSGGGGDVCCVHYVQGQKNAIVKVRWQSGGCYYHVHSTISNEVFDHIYSFFKEVDVPVVEKTLGAPEYMEVHFYPDGTVQVAVTDSASLPRLALNEDRNDKTEYLRCPNDKEPKE